MSLPPGTSAVAPEIKPDAIVDNVNDKTPEPATPPVVEDVPDPPRPDTDGLSELRTLVEGLATSVATLTEKVMQSHQDAAPTRVPWTHKGAKP